MHHVKRTRQTPEEKAAIKRREEAKIVEYNRLVESALSKKKEKDYSQEAFEMTWRVLQVNPEFYTMWNYRRLILINGLFKNISQEEAKNMVKEDLSMTTAALKIHPKVYWIWNHRMWCLENIPTGPGNSVGWKQKAWDNDLLLVDEMLKRDARNFHAWNYRRFILTGMPVGRGLMEELGYTGERIRADFSNFSAWHQRSKVLSTLWEEGKLDEGKWREEEFELIRHAMYTDPEDQSVWLYHRWLVGRDCDKSVLEREIAGIEELLNEQPKRCMESIVHYKGILIDKYGDEGELGEEMGRMLKELEQEDGERRERYRDLSKRGEVRYV